MNYIYVLCEVAIVSQLFIPFLFITRDCVKMTLLATKPQCCYASKSCLDTWEIQPYRGRYTVPAAGALKTDPTAAGGAGTKIESDSSDGLRDGLRRRWRAMPVGIACQVEPIHAKASACSLSFLGTWRNSHPSKYPLSCCTRKR